MKSFSQHNHGGLAYGLFVAIILFTFLDPELNAWFFLAAVFWPFIFAVLFVFLGGPLGLIISAGIVFLYAHIVKATYVYLQTMLKTDRTKGLIFTGIIIVLVLVRIGLDIVHYYHR